MHLPYSLRLALNLMFVQVKDLGPQFSYRGVFIVEYLGPIVIMTIAAARPAWLYAASTSAPLSPVAQ